MVVPKILVDNNWLKILKEIKTDVLPITEYFIHGDADHYVFK